jgi:hypothetical protein|tara:strand:+ start:313 stop:417 length:105 start_codon:yes stop_codon:yes gene_type:complete
MEIVEEFFPSPLGQGGFAEREDDGTQRGAEDYKY